LTEDTINALAKVVWHPAGYADQLGFDRMAPRDVITRNMMDSGRLLGIGWQAPKSLSAMNARLPSNHSVID